MSDQLETVTLHAARRGDESEELYVQVGEDGSAGWWMLDLVPDVDTLPEPSTPVRIVTTDPGREVAELRDRVAYLQGRVADERAAHAATQAEFPPVRVGLDVDQQIRCRAADIAVRSVDRFTPFAELVVLAGRWEAWFRDGSVPDAPA